MEEKERADKFAVQEQRRLYRIAKEEKDLIAQEQGFEKEQAKIEQERLDRLAKEEKEGARIEKERSYIDYVLKRDRNKELIRSVLRH